MSRASYRRSPRPLARTAGPPRRWWPWLLAAIVIITVVAASTGDHGLVRLYSLRAEHARIVSRSAEIDSDNERLRAEVRLLREDRRAIERIAREELGMARPGERIYQFGP
jgi:cell division protein FtsB